MRPEDMAGVTAEIFPQMIDAMPPGMKPMMIDGITAKVMPDMTDLIPDLLPETMESLMIDYIRNEM